MFQERGWNLKKGRRQTTFNERPPSHTSLTGRGVAQTISLQFRERDWLIVGSGVVDSLQQDLEW